MNAPTEKLNRKDFASDQEVRWCPGCGDYAILAAMQRSLPEVGTRPENTVFISGIGCSSRFPYYMSTYGFHTIHGRAPAIASGLKLARPELDVWVITGDGDALSIGGNHLLHVLRRDVDVNIVLFNNQIYGLTKGQYSPTSKQGKITPSTPMGSVDPPVTPARVALGAGGRFVARAFDVSKNLPQILRAAHDHGGASFVEVMQNCPVFNDGAFQQITDRKIGPEHQLWVEHGKPLRFGKNRERGLRLDAQTMALEIVEIAEGGVAEEEILIHDEKNANMAWLLASLPDPVAMGILYRDPAETSYGERVLEQITRAQSKGVGEMDALLRSGYTWTIE